ncbi:MAG: replication protein, partial [Armatimonadota bacterium]
MPAKRHLDDQQFHFEGFSTPNGTFVPDDLFDLLAPRLTEAELRVILYIIRRTFGFGKNSDAISLKQLTEGITTRDGRILDYGTGMSRKGVIAGIKGLLDKGIIKVDKREDERGENHINTYTLRFRDGVVTLGNYRSNPNTLPVVTGGYPQESVLQEPVKQQPPLPSNN